MSGKDLLRRIRFLIRLIASRARIEKKKCPYCGSGSISVVGRKFLILELDRCVNCGLMFRWPQDSAGRATRYYNHLYEQEGMTTDLPDERQLREYLKAGFAGTEKDLSRPLSLLKRCVPNGRVLDFGASWGYGTHQLRKAGYDAVGIEISSRRAGFGRERLGLEIVEDPAALAEFQEASFDGIFAYHVLEHLTDLRGVLGQFLRLLKGGGTALLAMPNCGGDAARAGGVRWGPMLCEKHQLAFDKGFFERNLPALGFSFWITSDFSEDYGEIDWEHCVNTSGDELLVLARKR